MSKLIIGLVGEIGSGKGVFIDVINKLLPEKNIVKLKFSDILADLLDILFLEKTRNNLQKMAIVIDEGYGEGTFNNAMKERVKNTNADIIIADGVRWPADEKMIRDLNGIMIYITADQKIRYKRTTQRGEKIGENKTTFEEFQKQELMKNETYIKDIGSRADYKIVNESDLEEFEKQVKKITDSMNF